MHPHPLHYSIHSCSNCSPIYHPFNIQTNNPTEPNSRWSGSTPKSSLKKNADYIIIDIGKPAIVHSITFGKFHRPHPCNLKLYRIWGSLAPSEGKGDFRALLQSTCNTTTTTTTTTTEPTPPPTTTTTEPTPPPPTITTTEPTIKTISNYHHYHDSSSHPVRLRGPPHRAGPKMELLAQGELKNDTVPETIPLRWKNDRVPWFNPSPSHDHHHQPVIIPVRYIKIEPLSATGSNYNCSIWHVSLMGLDQHHIVSPCLEIYEQWRASAALRLCLKHLRQTGHMQAFQALINSASHPHQSPLLVLPESTTTTTTTTMQEDVKKPAQFHFEHPLVSKLHSALVPQPQLQPPPWEQLNGLLLDHHDGGSPGSSPFTIPPISDAEQVVIRAALEENLFDPWASAEPPTLTCHQIRPPLAASSSSDLPCPRGGHQMCIDSQRRKIWLFGGFDGLKDLSDFWVYHLQPAPHMSLAQEDGAIMSHQHDHKETMHSTTTTTTTTTSLQSQDLHAGDDYNRWQCISRDVKLENGPMGRSCHKMVLDEATGDLYVLGRYAERGRPSKVAPSSHNVSNNVLNGHSERDHPQEYPNRLFLDTIIRRDVLPTVSVSDTTTTTAQPELEEADELMGEADAEDPLPHSSRPSGSGLFKNDLFRFRPFDHPESGQLWDNNGRIGKWECISQDTYAQNGPQLIFDHQMVLDSDRRKIYVFGGKIIQPLGSPSKDAPGSSSQVSQYSGMYEYDLTTGKWTQLMKDTPTNDTRTPDMHTLDDARGGTIPSRMGHSLMLDKKRQCLWILTGERDRHYYSDIWKYDIVNGRGELVVADYTSAGRQSQAALDTGVDVSGVSLSGCTPEAGFSQRTTFDPDANEWYMFCGLCRTRSPPDLVAAAASPPQPQPPAPTSSSSSSALSKPNTKSEMMSSSEFWRWRIDQRCWTKVPMKPHVEGADMPPPRFAHQMVLDSLTKTHYVFGGNPADNEHEPCRLGDFWTLKLHQTSREEALRRCLFALRRQHFIEMCDSGIDTVGALSFLQNELSSVTNHLDEREATLFRACTSHLLAGPGPRARLLEEEFDLDDDNDEEGDGGEGDLAVGDADGNGGAARATNGYAAATMAPARRYHKIREQRAHLFQSLLKFFPPGMTEPEECLDDLVAVWDTREDSGWGP
ncbi:hypothetical protein PCANC_06013 [Puccinia coronata f. sp. avenae]|uniref:Muskelin N-terminal domain-containing protein n=1 Tax=Puccinia coronata f. sp. avenae TaxID=200324 RepID=A0A2N5T576_9BASI|nr:hypothetical protein PCANC_06013 [Puccinia coronata f. sp. avenae]